MRIYCCPYFKRIVLVPVGFIYRLYAAFNELLYYLISIAKSKIIVPFIESRKNLIRKSVRTFEMGLSNIFHCIGTFFSSSEIVFFRTWKSIIAVHLNIVTDACDFFRNALNWLPFTIWLVVVTMFTTRAQLLYTDTSRDDGSCKRIAPVPLLNSNLIVNANIWL